MSDPLHERHVMAHIEGLVAEEHRLYAKGPLSDDERRSLEAINVELDRYWDLLRQRRAARETGRDPASAQLRPPGVVEGYEN